MRRVGEYPLWIGNARDARDIRAVLDTGIEATVDLAMEEPPVHPTRELVYLRFPLVDGGGNPDWLLRMAVVAVMDLVEAKVPTLVACSGGMSRSPAVIAVALTLCEWLPEGSTAVLERLRASGSLDVSPALWDGLWAART